MYRIEKAIYPKRDIERMDKGVIDRCEKFVLEAGERVQKIERKKEAVK